MMLLLPFPWILCLLYLYFWCILNWGFSSRNRCGSGCTNLLFDILLYPFTFLEEIFLTFHSNLIPKILLHLSQLPIKLNLQIPHIFLLLLHLTSQTINTLPQSNSNPTFQFHRNLTNNFLLHFLHFSNKTIFYWNLFIS